MKAARFIPAPKIDNRSDKELIDRAREFYATMQKRRTVRDFSDRPVPREVIEHCIRSAGAAPSGANLQPWHFVAITDPKVKREIRVAAEAEEKEFYEHRAPKAWLEVLAPLGTDWHKPFLETAPWLIAKSSRNRSAFCRTERARPHTMRSSQLELPQVCWLRPYIRVVWYL